MNFDLSSFTSSWFTNATLPERDDFRSSLSHALSSSNVTVVFTKADGTPRTMHCTLQESYLPPLKNEQELTTSVSASLDSSDVTTAIAEQPEKTLQVVWDIDANAWRSFRYDRIVSITAI